MKTSPFKVLLCSVSLFALTGVQMTLAQNTAPAQDPSLRDQVFQTLDGAPDSGAAGGATGAGVEETPILRVEDFPADQQERVLPGSTSDATQVQGSMSPALPGSGVPAPEGTMEPTQVAQTGEAVAPGSPDQVVPTAADLPTVSTTEGATRVETGEPQPFEPDPAGDPLTEEVTRVLREGGLLQRQEEIGQSLLLMDRQSRFVASVNNLLSQLGPDAEIEVAPGVFEKFSETPIGRQALIAQFNLERDVIAAQQEYEIAQFEYQKTTEGFKAEIERLVEAGLTARVEAEREKLLGDAIAEADRIRSEAVELATRAIEEGQTQAANLVSEAEASAETIRIEAEEYRQSLTQEIEALRDGLAERVAELDAREQDLIEREAAIASIPVPEVAGHVTFAITEINGIGGRYEAVVLREGILVRVREGDVLPDGARIGTITPTSLNYTFEDKDYRLTF